MHYRKGIELESRPESRQVREKCQIETVDLVTPEAACSHKIEPVQVEDQDRQSKAD